MLKIILKDKTNMKCVWKISTNA